MHSHVYHYWLKKQRPPPAALLKLLNLLPWACKLA
jgi:hypothetical protein